MKEKIEELKFHVLNDDKTVALVQSIEADIVFLEQENALLKKHNDGLFQLIEHHKTLTAGLGKPTIKNI